MKPITTIVLMIAALAAASPAAQAQTLASAEVAEAAGKCEADVDETLRRTHGRALRGVRFEPASRALVRGAGDDASLRGNGRYTLAAGGAQFQFSCAVNLKSGETSGVVVRDAATELRVAAATAAWEPDLTRVSPVDCESAVAALLTERNPRIARITFDADTRHLEPAPDQRTGLRGQGALQRAAGMLAATFSYRCEFDPRNGRVVAVQAQD